MPYKKDIKKNCLYCNKIFFTCTAEHNRGNGKYCSLRCSGFHNAKRKTVEELKSPYRKKKALFKWHQKQGHIKCFVKNCKWNITLELHRISPGINGGKYTKENTILICPNHHSLITIKKINIKDLYKY